MPRYRDMTNGELIEWADAWHPSHTMSGKLIYALARRLEATTLALDTVNSAVDELYDQFPKVARPHLSKGQLCWRCEGVLNSIGFGATPTDAYHAWARQLARPVQRREHRHASARD